MEVLSACRQFDLKALFGEPLARHGIRLVGPDEVGDPSAIRHAVSFNPAPDAFDGYPDLALICCPGAGPDALLGHPGIGEGVVITRLTDTEQARMMAGFAAWFVIGWHRRMWDYRSQQAAGVWRAINYTPPSEFPVGLLGYGNMGRAVAATLTSLGMPVTAWAGRARQDGAVEVLAGPDGLKRIARQSRAVVNVLALTEATRGLLAAPFFAAMRDDAMLINLGRGGHVIEADLLAALDRGRPAMAALDVAATEPLPAGHPFWHHERILLTPHVASDASPQAVAAAIARQIRQFDRGETPEGLVDRDRGY